MSTQNLPITENMITSSPAAIPMAGFSSFFGRVGRKTWEVIAGYLYRRALRRAERDLMSLDDRMLHDIGISRGEIPAAVRRAEVHHLMSIVPH